MSDTVAFEPAWRPHVALVRLNRPDKSNAQTAASVRAMIGFIQDAEDDPDTCCLVIRGSRVMFSGGADLAEMSHDDPAVVLRAINNWTKLFLAIRLSMLPIVTIVEGPCVGGGYHINLAADYSIATENAWFRHTGVDVGIAPMMPGTIMAPGIVGWKRASSLVLRPRKIAAAEALTLGICSEIMPDATLDALVDERLAELVGRDRMTVALAKAEMNAGIGAVLGASVLSQLAGFLHSVSPGAHAKMKAYHQALMDR